ncbi:MAG: hypothetical protein ACE5F8_04615 [Woeseiaceae bacterium]
MTADREKKVLRIPKKHDPGGHETPTPADGERLVRAQSVGHACFAAFIAVILFSVLWAMVSTTFGRVFPWMTLVLGMFVGLAVRRAGHGIDWRFPVIAALFATVGSIVANVVVAAANTAPELDTGTLEILRNVTSMTWPVFFEEVMTAADFVFAAFAAGLAAFYATRNLNRRQYQALRMWQESRSDD